MKIEIEKYKNIDRLELNVEDNKVNHIFGISGSGKSSIAKSLSNPIHSLDVKIGYTIDDCIISVNEKLVNNDEFSIFDLDNCKNLILSKEDNSDIYNILFSDNGDLQKIIMDYENVLEQFKDFKEVLVDFKSKIDKLITHFDIQVKNDGTLNKRSKFYNLENELLLNRKKIVIDTINDKGTAYLKWLQDGDKYKDSYNTCPYCNCILSKRKINSINNLLKLTPRNFEIIVNDNTYLEDVGIRKPKYTNKREVDRAKREIIDMYNFGYFIDNIIDLFDSYKSSDLDISKIDSIDALGIGQVNINVEKKPVEGDFYTFVNDTYDDMQRDSSFQLISSGAVSVGGKDALEYVYTSAQGTAEKEHKAVWFEKGGQAYVIMYSAPISEFEDNLYVFDFVLTNIQIT